MGQCLHRRSPAPEKGHLLLRPFGRFDRILGTIKSFIELDLADDIENCFGLLILLSRSKSNKLLPLCPWC